MLASLFWLWLVAAAVAGEDDKYKCLSKSGQSMEECDDPYCLLIGGCGSKQFCRDNVIDCCEGSGCNYVNCGDQKCLVYKNCDTSGDGCRRIKCYVHPKHPTIRTPFVYCDSDKGCDTSEDGKGGCRETPPTDGEKVIKQSHKYCSKNWCPNYMHKGDCKKVEEAGDCWMTCEKSYGDRKDTVDCPRDKGCAKIEKGDGCYTEKYECIGKDQKNYRMCPAIHGKKLCKNLGGCGTELLCKEENDCCDGDACNVEKCNGGFTCLKRIGCDQEDCRLSCLASALTRRQDPYDYCQRDKGCAKTEAGGCGQGGDNSCKGNHCNQQLCPHTEYGELVNYRCAKIGENCWEMIKAGLCWRDCKKGMGGRSVWCSVRRNCSETSSDGCGEEPTTTTVAGLTATKTTGKAVEGASAPTNTKAASATTTITAVTATDANKVVSTTSQAKAAATSARVGLRPGAFLSVLTISLFLLFC